MVNLHAAGTRAMMEAALEGVDAGRMVLAPSGHRVVQSPNPTYFDQPGTDAGGAARLSAPIDKTVMHYAANAEKAGLDGVVCSPTEAGKVHETCGKQFLTVTPGIRFADAGTRVTRCV
ncbi:MAG: orotidine 5'-phosphate decarboxylase / HUMPS family protein [Oscillospiraceae bacterium]